MAVLTGWWRRRSDPARFELYTRWTLYSFSLLVPLLAGGSAAALGRTAAERSALALLVLGHSAVCTAATVRALGWAQGRRKRPTALFAAAGAVSAAGVAATTATAVRHGDFSDAMMVFWAFTGYFAGPVALNLRSFRHVAGVVVGTTAVAALVMAAAGAGRSEVAGCAVMSLLSSSSFAFTHRCSAWMLRVVQELDAARGAQARLAVAEERLRFARDLHDVTGRNLAVIALKSELAVRTARLGRPGAVEQMAEVQRLAGEAQQEMRELVRGYRKVDLAAEVAGARSVLEAAGVECRTEGTGDEHTAALLPEEVQSAFGWVVREGTTNVLRHSEARQCRLRVRVVPGRWAELVLENDGAARDAAAKGSGGGPGSGSGGSGLVGLRERLAGAGGTLTAGPVAGSGGRFRLTARLPLAPADAPSGRIPRQAAGGEGLLGRVRGFPGRVRGAGAHPDTATTPVPDPGGTATGTGRGDVREAARETAGKGEAR
ncbi:MULTISPECIES: sensor histidine kinase [Streptomyces]|uniref:sensor histidine kinase n=1 Tax=Streptomyces TaxID=1883 RepID=UPI002174EC50|nr:histidine kinase [Streptomyces sp. SCUT-3]